MCEQAVGRVDADAVARTDGVRVDDFEQYRREFRGQVEITGALHVAADCLEEPERAVDRVVLERPGVGRIGEHALAHRGRVAGQYPPAFVEAIRLEEQALVRGHRVA